MGSPQIILRDIVAEVVEQEERIEVGSISKAEGTAQVHARAL
jgi:hypothetical protein